MKLEDGLYPTGRIAQSRITGCFIAWNKNGPVFLSIQGSICIYLPIFKSIEMLHETLKRSKVQFNWIQIIEDGKQFLEILPKTLNNRPLKVIQNPEYLDDGTCRFLLIQNSDEDQS